MRIVDLSVPLEANPSEPMQARDRLPGPRRQRAAGGGHLRRRSRPAARRQGLGERDRHRHHARRHARRRAVPLLPDLRRRSRPARSTSCRSTGSSARACGWTCAAWSAAPRSRPPTSRPRSAATSCSELRHRAAVDRAPRSAWGEPHYPNEGSGLGRDGTLWLLDRGVKVIGTDAWGLDRPLGDLRAQFERDGDPAPLWAAHRVGIEREYCQIEKLAQPRRAAGRDRLHGVVPAGEDRPGLRRLVPRRGGDRWRLTPAASPS